MVPATTDSISPGQRRVALVGLNVRAERLLIPGFQRAGNCALVALCSRSEAKAREAADRHSVPHAFGSIEALVAADVADTVFVNTPASAHAASVIAAARAGLAVICEKPLADTAASAREAAAAVATAGVANAVHFTMRGLAGPRMAARLLAQGRIGRLRHVEVAMLQPKELVPPHPGQSALVELGPHAIDLVRWWTTSAGEEGPPTLIGATAVPLAPQGPDAAAQALLRMGSGTMVSVLTSRVASGFENGIRALLCGDRGSIAVDVGARSVSLRWAPPDGPFQAVDIDPELEVSFQEFPAVQMRGLVASLDGSGQFPAVPEALAIQELQDAIAVRAGLDLEALARAGRP